MPIKVYNVYMVNFRVTDIQGGLLTIDRPAGQAISLRLAEIVRAQVMEVLPSGAVALKVKGEPLIAKTQVPLQAGTAAYFKVTGLPVEGRDLTLQFLGHAPQEGPDLLQQPLQTGGKPHQLATLIKEFQTLFDQLKGLRPEQQSPKMGRLHEINVEILKNLPSDPQKLPKELRAQLQDILQQSLRLTGNSVQSKIADLIRSLPPDMPQPTSIENLKQDISVNIDRLLHSSLKGAIQDTGVALEAKLKHIAQALPAGQAEDITKGAISKKVDPAQMGNTTKEVLRAQIKQEALFTETSTQVETSKVRASSQEPPQLHNDLKAKLLQLKGAIEHSKVILQEALDPAERQRQGDASMANRIAAAEQALNNIDGILRDIETLQTLSKATDSFYTFLPIDWKGLKEGDIAFKKGKGRGGGISPYSCRVNLDLHGLGPVGLIVMNFGGDFYVSMRAKDEGFRSALKDHLQELQESFAARGMRLRAVNVFDYDNTEGFEQIEDLAGPEGGINITA